MNIKKLMTIVFIILLSFVFYIGAGFYNNIHTVIEGQVYRSGQLSGSRLEKLIQNKKIKTIINLRGEHLKEKWHKTEKKISRENSIVHYDFGFRPHFLPDYTQINKLVELLRKVEKPYLIHCWRGAERAGMASALILSLEKDLPLEMVKKQFSIRYGVLFFKDSIGGLLFDEYEKWLTTSKNVHSKETLLSFLKEHYIDDQGNITYYIDSVSGIGFGKKKKVLINKDFNNLRITGWAYDAKHLLPVKDLYLKFGDRFAKKVENKIDRPDVIKFWGLESHENNLRQIGWEVNLKRDSLTSGCHDLILKFVYENKKNIVFNTGFELCIE